MFFFTKVSIKMEKLFFINLILGMVIHRISGVCEMGGVLSMKRLLRFAFLGIYFGSSSLMGAPSHVITFFFQKYPSWNEEKNTLSDPLFPFKTDFNRGIFVTYFGYKTISDSNGQATFPRKHQDTAFSLLVCENPMPIFMLHNTISHWEVEKNVNTSFYSVARLQDEKTKLYFWSIEKKELPKDRTIPLDTIIIHANPEGIEIPTGITLTSGSDQLVLPTVYVKEAIKISENALSFLQGSSFYGPIDRVFKINTK